MATTDAVEVAALFTVTKKWQAPAMRTQAGGKRMQATPECTVKKKWVLRLVDRCQAERERQQKEQKNNNRWVRREMPESRRKRNGDSQHAHRRST